jgi:uncharacterized protein
MGHAIRRDLTSPAALIVGAAIVIGGTFGGLFLAGTSAASSRSAVATDATIDVTGTGVARGTPDTLTMQIAVSTTEPTAEAALETNNAKMTALQAVFRRSGATPQDLQTTGLNLSPNYDSSGYVTGFSVEDDLAVTMHDLARVGAIIDDAADAVGNATEIEGISFSISDSSALAKVARTEAMANAKREASDLASAGGYALGPVMKITDHEQTSTPPPPIFAGTAAAFAKSAVPLQPGSEQLSVQVDVVYELRS